MTIVEQLIKKNVPPLYGQTADRDPVIVARIICGESSWACYVAEGSYVDHTFKIYGFFTGEVSTWAEVSVVDLEQISARRGNTLRIDKSFRPTRFSRITLQKGLVA